MSLLPSKRLGGLKAPPADHMPRAALVGALPHRSASRGHVKATEVATSALRLRRGTAGAGSSSGGSKGGSSSSASTSTSTGNVGSRAAQLFELEKEGGYVSTAPAPAPAAGSSSSAAGGDGDAADAATGDFLDAGWGVVAVAPAGGSAAAAAKPVAKKDKKKDKKQGPGPASGGGVSGVAAAAAEAAAAKRQARADSRGTPFVDKNSEAGITGLTLLQQRLLEAGRVAHSEQQKQRVAAEAAARRERLAQTTGRKKDWVDPDELDEGDEDEEMGFDELEAQQQYFELNLEADGTTEVVEFDEEGRERLRRAPGASGRTAAAAAAAARDVVDDDEDDPLAFLHDDSPRPAAAAAGSGSRSGAGAAGAGPGSAAAAAAAAAKRGSARRRSTSDDESDEDDDDFDYNGDDGLPGRNPIADEELEWGLDELHGPGKRPSLLRELGVIKTKKDKKKKDVREEARIAAEIAKAQAAQGGKRGGAAAAAAGGKGAAAAAAAGAAGGKAAAVNDDEDEDEGPDMGGVAWGGTGGASGIDMEAQEALLTRLFKPHKVKQLMEHQRAAEEELAAMKRKASGKAVLEAKTHSRMRIISGTVAGRQLASSKGALTRPMMEKVRQAIFNMIQAQAGSGGGLPTHARWLDFFAGTGSVGLEALSRGCRECHFIELDSWVCRKVLSRNIATCGFERRAVVHTMKAEDFLRRSIQLPRFAGGAFDFISVCPPYLVVSYPELMGLLEASPLLHDRSIVFVEYPKQLSHQVPATLGPLVTVRDRRYGRTWIRVYGPADGPVIDDDDDDEGEEGEGGGEDVRRRGRGSGADEEELLI